MTSTRAKRKTAYHHGDLKRALLVAARSELKKTGWQELSLRSVARRAGVTHTAAYHHFADKNALLATIAAEGFALLDKNMREAMDAAGEDPVDRLMASSRGYLKTASDDPAAYDLMFNGCDIDIGALMADLGISPFQRLVDAVVAARQASGTTLGDPMNDALMHWELVHGCAMLLRAGKFQHMGQAFGFDFDSHVEAMIVRLRALYPR